MVAVASHQLLLWQECAIITAVRVDDRRRRLERKIGGPISDEEWAWLEQKHPTPFPDPETDAEDLADYLRIGREYARLRRRRRESRKLPPDERHRALALILAAEAERDPEVRAFREEVLGGELVPRDQVDDWVAQHADEDPPRVVLTLEVVVPRDAASLPPRSLLRPGVGEVRLVGFRAETLSYRGRDGVTRTRTVTPGTVLGRLASLSRTLAARLALPEADTTMLVLAGVASSIPRGEVGATYRLDTPSLSRIRLEVDPRLSPREIARLYAEVRARVIGERFSTRRDRPLTGKHLQLAVFFAQKGDHAATWKDLRRLWNSAHPAWAYQGPNADEHFARDVRASWERVTGRRWPGRRKALTFSIPERERGRRRPAIDWEADLEEESGEA